MTPRFVNSSDGVRLAVHESGNAAAPTVVLVHGYPDNHSVWDGVAEILAEDFHVVSYDVRGCGESDKPSAIGAYVIPQLNEDLRAVIDAVSPDAPVHLVAHDWGSIQSWGAVCNPAFADRIATYTSISGPSLDMAGKWLRQGYRRPKPVAKQLLHSFYIALFQIPAVPELMARRGIISSVLSKMQEPSNLSDGVPGEAPRTEADLVNGIKLYKANMMPRLGLPKPQPTDIPVLVLAPEGDAHVSVPLALEAPVPYVTNLQSQTIIGGHWVVHQRPDLIADRVRSHIKRNIAIQQAPSR